ncbi:MAG: alcohol dehydrogenase catalytic domain-containing protein [Aestuariivirga sp.]
MLAARLHGKGDLRVERILPPEGPGPHEVRMAVRAAGICGSDLHNYRTGRWITRAPSTPGHEFAGEVVSVGAAVQGLVPGDRVVADSRFWCGACPACVAGQHHLCTQLGFVGEVCDGGFAEEVVLPARLLMKHDQGLASEVAATAEPLAVALHAVARLTPGPEDTVLVTGSGMIGALSALLLAQVPGRTVLIADRNAQRAGRVAEATGGRVVDIEAAALSAVSGVVEATGSAALLSVLPGLLPGGARIAMVGIYHGAFDLDPTILVEREISLTGCHAFTDELPQALALLPELSGAIASFLDLSSGIADVPAAYERIIKGQSPWPKTIIRCS